MSGTRSRQDGRSLRKSHVAASSVEYLRQRAFTIATLEFVADTDLVTAL
jgi:hypothetical protein